MSDTTFYDGATIIMADWLNEVNDHVHSSTPISPAVTVHPASVIANTPAGGIAATTVQAALNELDTDKVPLNGTGATGTWAINVSGNAATATLAANASLAVNATNATNATTSTTQASSVRTTAIATTAFVGDVMEDYSYGYNQTYQDVTGSRDAVTTFTNSSSRPITAYVAVTTAGTGVEFFLTVDTLVPAQFRSLQVSEATLNVTIPPGSTYKLTIVNGTLLAWFELK